MLKNVYELKYTIALVKMSSVFGNFSNSSFQQLKSTEQGFLGSLKINSKGEIVGKPATKNSLQCLTKRWESTKTV